MWRRTLSVFALLATMPLAADQDVDRVAAATVALPLEKYEELRKPEVEAVSATVVTSARISGRFGGGLTFVVEGRAIGSRPEVPLLSRMEGFELSECDGTALVRRTAPGAVSLLPTAERFRAACRVAAEPGRERLFFVAAPAVLHADASVADGRMEYGAEEPGGRAVTLLRTVTSRQVLPVTATGRYRITLLPDEVAFRYEIALHNPNRDRTPYAFPLANRERVERTEPVAGDEADGAWRIEAPAGDSTLVLTGRLPGARFTPPLDATAQMLLVETHPLVRADLSGPTRRVSPAEVGVATEYRGGRGFLLRGREEISWTTSLVEALRTGDVVVQRVDHGVYLARDGGLLAETRLAVENQGAPELSVLVPEPLFAGVQGHPVLLMPEKGGIRVPLDPGSQTVHVQHRAAIATFAGVLAARLPLLATSAETGRQHVVLALPDSWLPLVASFGTDRRFSLPGTSFFLWLALLVLLSERALAALVPPGRVRWTFALALGAAGMTSPIAFWTLLGALVLVGGLRLLAHLPAGSVTFPRTVMAFVVASALAYVALRPSLDDYRGGAGGLGGVSGGSFRTSLWEELRPPTMSQVLEAPGARDDGAMYQRGMPPKSAPPPSVEYRGLPVRREMPAGERGVVLDQPTAAHPRLFVLLVSAGWLTALQASVLALAAAIGVRRRGLLASGARGVLSAAGEGLVRSLRRSTPPVVAT